GFDQPELSELADHSVSNGLRKNSRDRKQPAKRCFQIARPNTVKDTPSSGRATMRQGTITEGRSLNGRLGLVTRELLFRLEIFLSRAHGAPCLGANPMRAWLSFLAA